ncbi:glutamine synthetase family protein [Faecalicoccus pleomorphus]|uniref:glutamine synthetase family protein n=1 Tax=Faecalicoccus pleomorphus TaxID=1323 RepID=UPI00195F8ADF|nr:glutamine synthetase family protein [Faecalicoccus pleomorphus]MBM6808460.1 glutamine synthetase [Faecalicoccus pleomorphus]
MYTKEDVLAYVNEENVTFIRLAYFDIYGHQKNISILPDELPRAFAEGISFDASAIAGFGTDIKSDLFLMPDPSTLSILPWRSLDGSVIRMYCDIQYPDGTPFELDTRYLLKQAEQYAKEQGIEIQIGTEFEFYLFLTDEKGQNSHIPLDTASYMDIAPEDQGEDVRKDICFTLQEMGLHPEASHHEEGPGQNEIDFRYSTPLQAADDAATFKWVVRTVAKANGLIADFDPKPLKEHSGNGMHVNVSVNDSSHLDQTRAFMAGILYRLPEITLFLNPCTESYQRLGERKAPKFVTWSYQNRSQAIRIPAVRNQKKRIELRSPDCTSNPYLVYLLIIYAGIEGILEQREPADPVDLNLYQASTEITSHLTPLPSSLEESSAIAKNSDFIQRVLPKEILKNYLK